MKGAETLYGLLTCCLKNTHTHINTEKNNRPLKFSWKNGNLKGFNSGFVLVYRFDLNGSILF